MPSPFPGMDPYLEDPGLWPDVHHALIEGARAFLTAQLRPKYFARVEERVYLTDEDDPGLRTLIPDVRIALKVDGSGSGQRVVSTLAVAEPLVATTLIDDEIHEARIEVLDRADRSVVTVIELLSPSNKVAGSYGRRSFAGKRNEVMRSPCHWVEIDLLRTGVPIKALEPLPPSEYSVHVSRVEERPKGQIWRVRLQERLPVIPIPLRAPDPDAKLDLQEVLNSTYDRAGYDLDLDYKKEPQPPLTPELATWADQWLRGKGLRS